MTEGTARDTVLQKTLQVLVGKVGLTPVEAAQLRLSHLHLAGKNPNISFTPAEGEPAKTVELDLEAHRALVGWLVARPDSKSDFLFPGSGEAAMAPAEIEQALEGRPATEPARPSKPPVDRPPVSPEATVASNSRPAPSPARPMAPPAPSRPMPPLSRPEPPPSRPELGGPPVGPAPAAAAFRSPAPPPAPPEVDQSVNIPLPTSAPKPPAPPFGMVEPEAEAEIEEPAAVEQPSRPAAEAEKPAAVPAPPGAGEAKPGQPAPTMPPPAAKTAAAAQPQPKFAPAAGPLTAAQAAAQAAGEKETAWLPRMVMSGSVLVIILTCVICLGGGWLAAQSGPGQALLASVGWSSEAAPATEEAESAEPGIEQPIFESPLSSPLATPTLPPTPTPTELPTNTPAPPTETPTPVPTDTPASLPTDTPAPTDTPVPTNTPQPEQPAETPAPEETPASTLKYGAPQLIEPRDGYAFIFGNTIVLRWEPVGELAPDEQYAVRLVYSFEDKPTYQGANIKDTEWLVPLSLFGQIDGPDNLYEWYVQVERLNDDGSGTAISPESERRKFTWR